jgi:hypothetical protein
MPSANFNSLESVQPIRLKKALKWVGLVIAIVGVMATCGVQKQIRDEYDVFTESSQALKEQDWDTFITTLGDRATKTGPPAPSQKQFFAKYVARVPEVVLGEASTFTIPSDLVPIPNHTTSHFIDSFGNLRVASVSYTDIRKRWSIPFVPRTFTIFKGKRVTYNFFQTFAAVARVRSKTGLRQRSWLALARFVREEQAELTAMGIEPKHLNYEGNWSEFITLMEARAERFRKRVQEAQSASPAKDSRRDEVAR